MKAIAHRHALHLSSLCAGLMFSLFSQSASAIQDGDYLYTVANGQATITGFGGPDSALVITNRLGGFPVVAIGDNAFSQLHRLSDVTIPEGVASIGGGAFQMCTSEKHVWSMQHCLCFFRPDSHTSRSVGVQFTSCPSMFLSAPELDQRIGPGDGNGASATIYRRLVLRARC